MSLGTPNNSSGCLISYLTGIQKIIIWKFNQSNYYYYDTTDSYACDYYGSGCTCMLHYCFDSTFTECVFGGVGVPCTLIPEPANTTNNTTTINSSALANSNSTVPSTNTTMNNITNTTSANTNISPSINSNNTPPYYPSGCFIYSQSYCQQFCKSSCQKCHQQSDICETCSPYFQH